MASIPTLGHITSFDPPELHGLRCMQVDRPFERHLIFYRYDELSLYAERAVPGARDLSRRLTQEPGFEGE
jgi:hypothetical protein